MTFSIRSCPTLLECNAQKSKGIAAAPSCDGTWNLPIYWSFNTCPPASACFFFFFFPVNSDCSSFAALHWNMGEITIPRRLFLWCMSLIYMCAFVSLYVQIPGNNVHVYVVRAQSHTESCVGKNVSLLTTLAKIFNLCVRFPLICYTTIWKFL